MTLSEIRDWMKTVIVCPQWYLNSRGTGAQSITLYSTTGAPNRIAVGGLSATGYQIKAVSILVHWGKSPSAAEDKAQEVYDAMFGQTAIIGGKRVNMFQLPQPAPIGVGVDGEGIYEFVIETHIYHER